MEVLDCHWRPIEVPELVDEGLAYIGGISAELDNPKAKVIRAAIRRLGSGSPSSLSIVHIRRMLKEFGSTSVE